MVGTVASERGRPSSLWDWHRWGFALSDKPLQCDGRYHTCHQELKNALVHVGRHTEYVVVCYVCARIWRTGLHVYAQATSDRKIREAAANWTGGWE